MSQQPGQSLRLLSLPAEVQRLILKFIFSSSKIGCDYGAPIVFPTSDDESESNVATAIVVYNRYKEAIVSDGVPIYELNKDEMLQLTQYNHLFDSDAHLQWESYVTFHFPSTVAMLDILLGPSFPVSRRALIRKLVVHGTPLPLYGFDKSSYVTHSCSSALQVIEGLQLRSLHYHDVYLRHDDGWGRMGYPVNLTGLLEVRGWQELKVFSPDPEFVEAEVNGLDERVKDINTAKPGFDMCFTIHTPVKISTDDGARLSVLNYSSHCTAMEASTDVEDDMKDDELLVIAAQRSSSPQVTAEAGSEARWGLIPDLLAKMSWHELRMEGSYLVDEGIEDPCGHL